MPPFVFALVLFSACMHATWNALLRSSADRFWTTVVMGLAITLVLVPVLPFLPFPPQESWPYLALSVALHIGYSLFLINAYKHGELGHVYPIARGSSPLLIALGAAVFAHEHLTILAVAGVALVSGGIISLAHPRAGASRMSVFAALGTGIFIAAYSVTDGIGARIAGHALSYSAWMFASYGVVMLGIYRFRKGSLRIVLRDTAAQKAAFSGIIALFGYSIIIWAMTLGPMGPVSATRETSVVFAALIGRFFLHESLTARRMMACIVIAAGAACLG